MCHPPFPLMITCYHEEPEMKASREYLEHRAHALVTVHSREFVRDALQMITRNKIIMDDSTGEIFVLVDGGQKHFLV